MTTETILSLLARFGAGLAAGVLAALYIIQAATLTAAEKKIDALKAGSQEDENHIRLMRGEINRLRDQLREQALKKE